MNLVTCLFYLPFLVTASNRITSENSSLFLWAPPSRQWEQTVPLQFPSFTRHRCGQACRQGFRAAAYTEAWQTMHHRAPGWRLAEAFFPPSWSWVAGWWKGATALLCITHHSPSWGTADGECSKNNLFPLIASSPSSRACPKPSRRSTPPKAEECHSCVPPPSLPEAT